MSKNGKEETGQEEWPNAQVMIVEYNPDTRNFRHAYQGQLPVNELLGYLELVKSMLLDQQKVQIYQHQQRMQASKIQVAGGIPPGLLKG